MFEGSPNGKKKAQKATKALSNYPENKSHDRHFDIDDCEDMGLAIKRLESDPAMQDLVLTVHHCYLHVLMNTTAFKIIENHTGVALVKMIPSGQLTPTPRQMADQP